MGWFPYHTREEFDNYSAEPPELEPFPSYDFGAPRNTSEKDAEDEGGVSRSHLAYVSDLGGCLSVSNCTNFFAGMAMDAEKKRCKTLLGKDRARARAQQKKQHVAPSSSRPTSRPANQHLLGPSNSHNCNNNNNNDLNNNHSSHDSNDNKPPPSSSNSHCSLNNQSRCLLLPPSRPWTLSHLPDM